MKKILIAAVYYPPCNRIGAKRPFKIAKFLSQSGWDVTVLTVDPSLTPPIGRIETDNTKIKTIRTKAFVPYVALRNKVQTSQASGKKVPLSRDRLSKDRGKFRYGIGRLLKYLVHKSLTSFDQIDDWSGWRKPALKAMKKEIRILTSSSAPFHHTALHTWAWNLRPISSASSYLTIEIPGVT